MVLVTANKTQRLLLIQFMQRVSAEEIRGQMESTRAMVAEFADGFRLLSDLEKLQSMEAACAPVLGQMMDTFKKHRIELVVRVIPEPEKDIGLNILSVFHYGRGVRTVTCDTIAEALRVLRL